MMHHLVLGLAVCSVAGYAAASDAPPTAISELRKMGEVACQPSLPFFCSNMHVSCSGQTSIRTFPFKLRATSSRGSIESAPETENIRQQYEDGRAEWDSEGTYVILRPRRTNGYIKLLSDGTYSFRHYSQHLGVMSLGHCS
ncbi:MAG: hypothetical protein WA210_18440 [Burkholderiaceae bacterium]